MPDIENEPAVTMAAVNIRRDAMLADDIELRLTDASAHRLASEADPVRRMTAP